MQLLKRAIKVIAIATTFIILTTFIISTTIICKCLLHPKPCWAVLSCSVVSNCLRPHELQPTRLLIHRDSPDKDTRKGSHALLQGIFPTQGSNPGLPCCRQILYHLSHQGNPRILDWVAYPFSRGPSQPNNRSRVFGIAGKIFTS